MMNPIMQGTVSERGTGKVLVGVEQRNPVALVEVCVGPNWSSERSVTMTAESALTLAKLLEAAARAAAAASW